MIVILRGHIRNTFTNNQLYILLKIIQKIVPIKLYIHTWNVQQSNVSWRNIESDNTAITKELICGYFKDIPIKHIIIDDDKKIELVGNVMGNIIGTAMPTIGWKKYWYGQHQIINFLKLSNCCGDELILNIRFDILNNSCSFTKNDIVQFVIDNSNKKISNNYLINCSVQNGPKPGCDNAIIGNIDTI